MLCSKVLSLIFRSRLHKSSNTKTIHRQFQKSMTDNNHLDRTADSGRHNVISLATVTGLREESKTVKSFKLKVQNEELFFKAGQWVDMFIPQVSIVGGFSMCSSPEQLETEKTLSLAVKYSKHPPAEWVHTQCAEGTQVNIRVGGDVYYDPIKTEPPHDLLLIAGGIGINPLLSIMCHVRDQLKSWGDKSIPDRLLLMYSASTQDELIFQKEIKEMTSEFSQLRCKFFITREGSSRTEGRISEADLSEAFSWLRVNQTKAYICGPSPMITDIENLLFKQGLSKQNVLYEKWW